ncbi:MAG: hypothetical protein AB1847_19825 [bacterium]
MEKKVKDLTIQELRDLVSNIVKETMEEFIEDMLVLASKNYLAAIDGAGEDDHDNKMQQFEETFDA